ncbi:MAG: phosphoribosylformylglycinamidine synthase subunit PurL, partial [Elusimicrobiota bacterium]
FFDDEMRQPSVAELEMIAQAWSEHTRHKTLRGRFVVGGGAKQYDNLLKETVFKATKELRRPWVLSAFKDNAGIVALDKKWAVAIKVETHNHPSALHPYGGASTGVGGVIRDILGAGRGAWPIANIDVFCVSQNEPRTLAGLIAGVRDYGNRMGIPTVAGAVVFDEGYKGLPLVFCGTIGLMARNAVVKPKPKAGDLVYLIGNKTGRDGIHGATFSSQKLQDGLPPSVVQIGNPILEKKVWDFLEAAQQERLYTAITDLGAGGIACAIWELADWGSTPAHPLGVNADIGRVPLKEPAMDGWEVLVSESQERMLLAVEPKRQKRLEALLDDFELDASCLGTFAKSSRVNIRFKDEHLVDLPLALLREVPKKDFHFDVPAPASSREAVTRYVKVKDIKGIGLKVLSLPDVASKEWIVRQYDHEVGGRTIGKPFVGKTAIAPADGAVIKPLYDSRKAVAIGLGLRSRLSAYGARLMAEAAVCEAIANLTALGGGLETVSLLDNYCAGQTSDARVLNDLVEASEGLYAAAKAFGAPFISGKDSLNNTLPDGANIPTVVLVSALGILKDLRLIVDSSVKRAGDDIYVLGATRAEFAGSQAGPLLGSASGVPHIDLAECVRITAAARRALGKGLAASCHDISDGGIFAALAEMTLGSDLGIEADLGAVPGQGLDAVAALFAESVSRFVFAARPAQRTALAACCKGLPFAKIGRVTARPGLVVSMDKRVIARWRHEELCKAFLRRPDGKA